MDFASLMSAQIAKKAPPSTKSDAAGKDKQKYQRRADAESAREAAYHAEQAAREAEKHAKDKRKRELEGEEAEKERERRTKRLRLAEEARRAKQEEEDREERARRKRLGLPELPTEAEIQAQLEAPEETPAEEGEDIGEDELLDKLRGLKEPVRLFGEDHSQRMRRYKKLCGKELDSAITKRNSKEPIPTSLESVLEAECKIPDKIPPASDAKGRLFFARQLTTWFNLVLREWAVALAGRSESTKKTLTGQQASNSLTQALSHLGLLFRKLERLSTSPEELPDDLLKPIGDIVRAAQERRYVHANDGYLQLSIGKAAWPIGVTMVGIHERSAREKISDDSGKAHIMTDEVTRKILQSIKRCLSFAQTRWPPDDVGQLMG